MLDIVKNSPICNGNGSVGGRGVLRRKLTRRQRVSLATDVALGLVHVEPSMKQAAAAVGVRPDEIRAELKARAKARDAAEQQVLQVRQEREGALAIIDAWNAASDWGGQKRFASSTLSIDVSFGAVRANAAAPRFSVGAWTS